MKTVDRSGNLFIICGPPGSGKTTLIQMVNERGLPLRQIPRLTTRASRPEDGDSYLRSLEYEFVSEEEFAGRVARGSTANLIEWNGNFYATDLDEVRRSLALGGGSLLLEDMPTAVHLKHALGSQATVIMLFTEDADELLRLEFATVFGSTRASIREWHRRLRLKYDAAVASSGTGRASQKWSEYLASKLRRAIPDLAFMAGKIRNGEDILVLGNRRDEQLVMFAEFCSIVETLTREELPCDHPGKFVFVLMPFRDPFDKVYKYVIKPAVEQQGLRCLRGDEISTRLNIVDDVMSYIERAEVIITDISGGNPNVFLELGVSLNLKKRIILISTESDVPFDVRTYRQIRYDDTTRGWEVLSSQIVEQLRQIVTNSAKGKISL